jgi:hypothetical protein
MSSKKEEHMNPCKLLFGVLYVLYHMRCKNPIKSTKYH